MCSVFLFVFVLMVSPVMEEDHRMKPCYEFCFCKGTEIFCSDLKRPSVPSWQENDPFVTLYYLRNNVTHLEKNFLTGLNHLENLYLDGNPIRIFSSGVFDNISIKSLSMKHSSLKNVPEMNSILNTLETLDLGFNRLKTLDKNFFLTVPNLQKLFLNDNWLTEDSLKALENLKKLEVLHLGNNSILMLSSQAFSGMDSLRILTLWRNRLQEIRREAFCNLKTLKALSLNNNHLDRIPDAIKCLNSLEELFLAGNRISHITDDAFVNNLHLKYIELKGNPLISVGHKSFSGLTRLKKLILSDVKELHTFPNLSMALSLEIIHLDRAKIKSVPNNLCQQIPLLKSLNLRVNRLRELPNLSGCRNLKMLDLSYNDIARLNVSRLIDMPVLQDLILANNKIQNIPAKTFQHLHSLAVLDISENEIIFIDPDAFLNLKRLENLNVAGNFFPHMPVEGLENLLYLKCHSNPNLKDFPAISFFPRLKSIALSYAYHCCPFRESNVRPVAMGGKKFQHPVHETILYPHGGKMNMSLWKIDSVDSWDMENVSHTLNMFMPKYVRIPKYNRSRNVHSKEVSAVEQIHCAPMPGPFMPCEDLFDWWSLRCGIWLVLLLALLGNGCVIFVTAFSQNRIDVPRFLICNLAWADFLMGIYLGFLAVVDASTLGHFKLYGIRWQMSAACRAAGFIGVFSSELSVFTLAVITFERNYAITNAMNLNKRLSLRNAIAVMAAGWGLSLALASLPLFGVSDYRKFAVCLPFEVRQSWSFAYVLGISTVNGASFLILIGCYLRMYFGIKDSQAWNSNDSRIAKRMALLVFTDFLCWFPISFFSIAASFGIQLVSLEEAKILTVFVLPLNSCCNPFLYAILTKQFKKDCVAICKSLEESRITRGIGRCKNELNFSARHACSNSLTHSVGKEANSCSCLKNKDPGWIWFGIPKMLRRSKTSRTSSSEDSSSRFGAGSLQRRDRKTALHDDKSSFTVSSRNQFISSLIDRYQRNGEFRRESQDSSLSGSRMDSYSSNSTTIYKLSHSSVSRDSDKAARRDFDTVSPLSAAGCSFPPKIKLRNTDIEMHDLKGKFRTARVWSSGEDDDNESGNHSKLNVPEVTDVGQPSILPDEGTAEGISVEIVASAVNPTSRTTNIHEEIPLLNEGDEAKS